MENLTISAVERITSPNPFCLIGTEADDGSVNLAAVSWWSYACNRPPMISVCLSNRSYTSELICRTRKFTLQIVPEEYKEKAFLCGTVSGRECSKPKRFGISLENNVDGYPDYVMGSAAVLNCSLLNQMEASDHTLFLARAEIVKVRPVNGILYALDGYRYLGTAAVQKEQKEGGD
ncbi:flavin reductase family protein [Lacrimispora sp. NSJ-141]|uniref:Flavin reductase family protein n=1 Tax=Lientehia hominis TaxID=2897778 RepID=A0AAP2WAQ5_9FIRM|nr:flavin reductase family protein [Lientehia hominis]MCD2493737.1 flavin reductase family protein [Lientehia hominis]